MLNLVNKDILCRIILLGKYAKKKTTWKIKLTCFTIRICLSAFIIIIIIISGIG